MNKILELIDFQFYYDHIHAVKGISLEVYENEVVTLIGANGAGKSTTLRAISGFLGNIKYGEIKYKGEIINTKKAHFLSRMGIMQVLEGRHIFPFLTVKENLEVGGRVNKESERRANKTIEYVYHLFPRLKERELQKGGTLSGGEQQMLAVGRALMSCPEILLLDEPSLGLAPILVREIFKAIEQISNDGTTILLVEQNSRAALKVADRGYVLETGNIVLSGESKALMNNEDVRKSYLGEG